MRRIFARNAGPALIHLSFVLFEGGAKAVRISK
jgi:hypothetical protein